MTTIARSSPQFDLTVETKQQYFSSPASLARAIRAGLSTLSHIRKGCRAPICRYESLPSGTLKDGSPNPGRAFSPIALGAKALVVSPSATTPTSVEGDGAVLMHYGCAARYRGRARADAVSEWVQRRWRRQGERERHIALMKAYWHQVRALPEIEKGSNTERRGIPLAELVPEDLRHASANSRSDRDKRVSQERRQEIVRAAGERYRDALRD